jgi:hypothetical protein
MLGKKKSGADSKGRHRGWSFGSDAAWWGMRKQPLSELDTLTGGAPVVTHCPEITGNTRLVTVDVARPSNSGNTLKPKLPSRAGM